MARNPKARSESTEHAGAQADPIRGPVSSNAAGGCEEISLLAYAYWQARGCPEGSPEEDWLRAEQELRLTGGSGKKALAAEA
jgi:hypothetical protein